MSENLYTPGHGQNATDFMSRRSFDTHGQFFSAYLSSGMSVLDCGCGPGSITMGIAEQVFPGKVVGVDFGASQIAHATAIAASRSPSNVAFQTGDCYSLPFDANTFDRVFSHALFEHLSDPVRALKELQRVLKPGGVIGLCTPDWGGFILSPPSSNLANAVSSYTKLQSQNGGDVGVGRKLGAYLGATGFEVIQMSARYECYSSLHFIGEYLALQLEQAGDAAAGRTFRDWSESDGGMFAQAWVSAIGRKIE